jgi:hypothetical protein
MKIVPRNKKEMLKKSAKSEWSERITVSQVQESQADEKDENERPN